jgi:hypothetical protein
MAGVSRANSSEHSPTANCLDKLARVLRKDGHGDPARSPVNRRPNPRLSVENALTTEFLNICSLEHGTTDAKPSAETAATPDTSATTKTTQACATTRTQSVDETSLKPLKVILEAIREQADCALRQLQQSEEERSTQWRCKDCKYTKHFTRPVPLEAAGRCLRCKSISFQCVA